MTHPPIRIFSTRSNRARSKEALAGKWIVELAELAGPGQRDSGAR